MKTSEKIKMLRLRKGLSQEALGDLVGLKKAAINKYETERVVNIKKSMLQKLADALDVSPADLLDDPDPVEKALYTLAGEKQNLERLQKLTLTDKDLEFIELYCKLPEEKKEIFFKILLSLLE